MALSMGSSNSSLLNSQFQGKGFLIILKKKLMEKKDIPVYLPPLWENIGPISSKLDIIKFLQYSIT